MIGCQTEFKVKLNDKYGVSLNHIHYTATRIQGYINLKKNIQQDDKNFGVFRKTNENVSSIKKVLICFIPVCMLSH